MSVQALIIVIILLIGIQMFLRRQFKQQNKKQRGRFNTSDKRREETIRHLVDEEDD